MNRDQYFWGVTGLGMVWLAAVVFGVWPDPPATGDRQMIRFMFANGVGTLAWWGAIAWITRGGYRPQGQRPDYRIVGWMVVIALAARVFLLVVTPETTVLSDDVYRYMWDGRMTDLGINPFYFSPDNDILAPVRDTVFYPGINHPYLPTIYPPLSQAVFWIAYRLTPASIVGFKIVSLLIEIGGWIAAWWYLRGRKSDPNLLVVLLWCPLAVWEFSYSAHLDIIALPLLILGLAFLTKRRPLIAAALLAAAGSAKFFGWMFLPLCLWDQSWRTRWQVVGIAAVTVLALYAPFLRAGSDIIGSLPEYLSEWRFNGSLYQVLARWLNDPSWLRWVLGGMLALWVLVGPRLWKSAEDRWLAIWTGYVIATTTLFPWYMLWVLPALLKRRRLPMLWLVGTIFLSYQFLIDYDITGVWADYRWCVWLEYGIFYILLFRGLWQSWQGRRVRLKEQIGVA